LTRPLVKRIDMANHFAELCAEHEIVVRFTLAAPEDGAYSANHMQRRVTTRPIRNTGFYVSALHEIGHIVGPHQDKSRLWAEWGAWIWAKENAIVWTDTAWRVTRGALTSYSNAFGAETMPDDFRNWINIGEENGYESS
jgi:hypothetical protein